MKEGGYSDVATTGMHPPCLLSAPEPSAAGGEGDAHGDEQGGADTVEAFASAFDEGADTVGEDGEEAFGGDFHQHEHCDHHGALGH